METTMDNELDWNDSMLGMLGAVTLAGFLTSCAWLLNSL
jgi:hypothetical protein